ncbi:hypothetical protein EFK50_11555 [Nocardioides marmoriginsengisoli]|uniref:Uncharacterized protein n=1 Tax=Nocardioides marmoriginsengisoli TaxID=661483 RepID=A0A3N0CG21_9ACTN|nr:hypothetical protein [Nocardioides marmoriginsengisoli]RNL62404.1 hypothetical protein EFK50_11555 [Nocardioides marmoriginsengisoli]
MSTEPGPELTPAERAARRKRLAEVFGDVLPDQTSDDLSPEGDVAAAEDWLKRQVPPHHG